jgi:DNA polymerase-3 subunit delta'
LSIFNICHQDTAIDRIEQALSAGRLHHGYLFAGQDGIGKTTTAKELAGILLCDHPVSVERQGTNPWQDRCGQCAACKLVDSGNHPDLHMVYKELISTVSGKEKHQATELGIDVIRQEIIEKVALRPSVGRNKIFVLLQAELMNRSAQNALLKTLEEPPSNTYLFLIVEQLGAMLPTIRSRTQTVVFQPLPESFVMERLAKIGASEVQSSFLARFCPGSLGPAMELYQLGVYDLNDRLSKDLMVIDSSGVDDFAQWVIDQSKSLAEKMGRQDTAGAVKAKTSESEANRSAVKLILALTGGFFRDCLRYKLGFDPDSLLNRDRIKAVETLAAKNDLESLRRKIQTLSRAETMIDANVNVTIVVTDVFYTLFAT